MNALKRVTSACMAALLVISSTGSTFAALIPGTNDDVNKYEAPTIETLTVGQGSTSNNWVVTAEGKITIDADSNWGDGNITISVWDATPQEIGSSTTLDPLPSNPDTGTKEITYSVTSSDIIKSSMPSTVGDTHHKYTVYVFNQGAGTDVANVTHATKATFEIDINGNVLDGWDDAPAASAAVAITAPTAPAYLNDAGLATFAGTATEKNNGAVTAVRVALKDNKTGKYYNETGGKFDKTAQHWYENAIGTTNWTYDLSSIKSALMSGNSYTLYAHAQDTNTGVDSSLLDSVTFIYDTTPPSITNPTGSVLISGEGNVELKFALDGPISGTTGSTTGGSELANNVAVDGSSFALTADQNTSVTASAKYVRAAKQGDKPSIVVTVAKADLSADKTYTLTFIKDKLTDLAGNVGPASAHDFEFTPVSATPNTIAWNDGDDDIATSGVSKTFGDQKFTYAATAPAYGAVTYGIKAGEAQDVAEIDAATGEVAIKKAGSTVITATSEAGGTDAATGAPYSAVTIEYTLTVAKADPTITFGNVSQTEGNITAVTATVSPASTDTNDAVVVEYEIPVPGSELVHCDCGFGNKLAHARDCAYVADQSETCDCAYNNSSDETTLHGENCAYKVADADSKCNCGLGDTDAGGSTPAASHASDGCTYKAAVADTTQWLAWDGTPLDTTYGSVKAYLDSLKDGAKVDVRATISGTGTNLNAKTETAQLAINASGSGGTTGGGGGGGTSSYTVKFDAGKNGKIAKGNASTSVSSGSKVASSKVPTIEANEGYKFLGWSLDGKTTVDPTEQKITKSVTFTALYETLGVKSELAFDKTVPGGYMSGYPDGTFGPERSITREEVAAMFARILTEKMEAGKSYPSVYTDVAANRWSANAVGFLSGLGVIEGYGDGTFKPEQAITRAEFISMVVRVDGVITGEDRFSDISGHWARENIQAGAEKGFIAGYPDGSFKPQQSITRAEAVTIVNRVLGVQKGGDMPYTDVPAAHWAHGDIAAAAR